MTRNLIFAFVIFFSSKCFAKYASISTVNGNLLLVFDKQENELLEYSHETFKRDEFFEILGHFPSFVKVTPQLLSLFSNHKTIHAVLLQRGEDTFNTIPKQLESNGNAPALETQAIPLHLQNENSASY